MRANADSWLTLIQCVTFGVLQSYAASWWISPALSEALYIFAAVQRFIRGSWCWPAAASLHRRLAGFPCILLKRGGIWTIIGLVDLGVWFVVLTTRLGIAG